MTKSFVQWLEEKKKKGTKESLPSTSTSSPLRGANQDYSGVGVKNDNADYTISDEHKHDLNHPAHGAEWEDESKTTRKGIVRHMLKKLRQEETVNEIVSGVGDIRIKPVNMAQKTGGTKSSGAPSNVNKLQAASDKRVAQLDRAAQKQKEHDENERIRQQKQRESEQQKRQQKADSMKQGI